MIEGLKNLVGFRRVEKAGCGFLAAREVTAWLEDRLGAGRRAAFEKHTCRCSPCSLLVADAGSFQGVLDGGLLASERREFESTQAILKAAFRLELEGRKAKATGFGFTWNRAMGAAAAMLLLAVVTVISVRDTGTAPGVVTLPGGDDYTVGTMPFSAPPITRGENVEDLWKTAGVAYEAGRYAEAARLFGEISVQHDDSYDAALYRGISLVMTGDHAAASESLENARRIAESQGMAAAAASYYLGVAALGQDRQDDAIDNLRQAEAAGGSFGDRAAELLSRIVID